MKTKIIYSLALLVGLTSCKSCKDDKQYKIKGRLMYDCDTPANGSSMGLQQKYALGNDGFIEYFNCDENGYFEVVYTPSHGGDLYLGASGPILEGIPARENLDLGEVFFWPPSIDYVIRLNVSDNYTENDTLKYPNFDAPSITDWKKISGPFTDGQIIDTVMNRPLRPFPIFYEQEEFSTNFNYEVNPETNINNAETCYIYVTNLCSSQMYEAFIEL